MSTQNKIPYVAIVGRPNVGKSTLFNRLIQKKVSITSETEGTTRDRVVFPCNWLGRTFNLIDTGGFINSKKDFFQEDINKQVEIAIDYANIIVFVVSIKEGITKEDQMIASKLKKTTNKKIIIAVNKSDSREESLMSSVFSQFGFEDIVPISSIHGLGTGNLLDLIANEFKDKKSFIVDEEFKVAIIGKPNVGKSSLLNTILRDDRVIVSEKPGTTRDSIDTHLKWQNVNYTFIDTAGIKKNKDSLNDIEFYSELRSKLSIDRANLVLLILDYTQGVTHIDESLMSQMKDQHKPTLIVFNKSDLYTMDNRKENEDDLAEKFKFAPYSPVIYVSAKEGKNIHKIFEWIEKIRINLNQQISKEDLNKFLQEIQMLKLPPRQRGVSIKLTYMTFFNDGYPHFIIFSNRPELIHFSYKRFIENQLRNIFNFEGLPLKISYKLK